MKQLEIYFNTVHLSGSALSEANQQADCQGKRIMEIMTGTDKMTPIECWDIYRELYGEILLTSVRRSMNTLTRDGKLVRLDDQKKERFGHPNFYWKAV